MQSSSNPNEITSSNPETVCLTAAEAAIVQEALQAIQPLFAVSPQGVARQWLFVLCKVSLAMTHYFSECNDESLQQNYTCMMEMLSDFVCHLEGVNEDVVQEGVNKLRRG